MSGVRISGLPPVSAAMLTDIFPVVQGGVTSQETLAQVQTLFGMRGGIQQLAYGGTGAALTANNGGIFYSTATAGAILAGTATASQMLQSGATAAPVWSTATWPATTTVNQLLYSSSANVVTGLATANNSVLVTSASGVPSLSTVLPGGLTTADPTLAQGIATKNYVDTNSVGGFSVYAATTGTLGTVTQSGAGVGATLTNAGAQATLSIDGVNPPVNSVVLVKNTSTGATSANEGIYTVTSVGSGSTNWVLTRSTSYDTPNEINGIGLIIVQNGTTLNNTAWYNTTTIVTVDTTAFSYLQYGIAVPVTLAQGGTSANLTASNGGIFYSSATAGAILAGTATAGLALLSGASTAPTWSASPPITRVALTVITTTGASTYTPTAGTQYCVVELAGGGAGGGGGQGSAGQGSAGGGGGGAGYCRKLYTAVLLGANAAVVIGTGGAAGASGANAGAVGVNSTFTPAGAGAILTASGGTGGVGGVQSASATGTPGGGGGTGTNGDINITGQRGIFGLCLAAGVLASSAGGSCYLSAPGNIEISTTDTGYPGNLYGGGGSGGLAAGSSSAGSAGASGVCIITEYISV